MNWISHLFPVDPPGRLQDSPDVKGYYCPTLLFEGEVEDPDVNYVVFSMEVPVEG